MVNKCESPIHHGVCHKSIKLFLFSSEWRTKAIQKFPNFQWKNVKFVCTSCKSKIVPGEERKLKRRGRKKSGSECIPVRNINDQNQQEGSDSHLVVGNEQPDDGEQAPGEQDANILEEEVFASQEYEMDMGNVAVVDPLPVDAMQTQETASLSQASSTSLSQSTQASSSASTVLETEYILEDVNMLLSNLRITRITKTTLYRASEIRECWQRCIMHINAKFIKLINGRFELEPEKCKSCDYCDTLFLEMCEKYRLAKTKTERFQILTSLPGKYNANVVAAEAGCSYYTALKAMTVRAENGCFSSLPPKSGNKISPDVVALVLNWYHDDNNSRPSPKMNDTVKGLCGERIPRRHMLMNQADAMHAFKQENPNAKIKKTKFLEFCPKNCVWPKHRPYHNVCVCVICKNFEFLYEAIGKEESLTNFVEKIMCNPIRQECAYGLCNDCPIMDTVFDVLDEIQDENVVFKQWKRTDGTELETVTLPSNEFSQKFLTSLGPFIEHDFVKKSQKVFIKDIKGAGLRDQRAILIVVDFAQNYSMIVQNAVQGYHWSGKQATVHPFSLSWIDPIRKEMMEKHYVVISDEMAHDADTFNCFKRKVVSQIKIDFEDFNPTHIFYVSDGAAGQYKNYKNFAHLMEHHNDFQITAEWTFTATGHGKGPCDRVAAVVKSTTRIHSLKQGNYILTPKQMYEFCARKLQSDKMNFMYITKDEVAGDREVFKQRYAKTRKIVGTRSYHHFSPLQDGCINLRKVGGSEEYVTFAITKDYSLLINLDETEPGDFVCFVEAGCIQVGMFVERDDEYAELQCFKIARRSFHLSWPAFPVYRKVPLVDILMKLGDPTPAESWRYYTYTDEEIRAMHEKHDEWIERRH